MNFWKVILITLAAGSALAGEPRITCEPRELHGVPGEPLQLEITITADRASPIHIQIPHIDNLHLRTVEKVPIRRTADGRYMHKRIILWQGLEAGSVTLTNLTVVFQALENKEGEGAASFQTLEKNCPHIGILIDEVEPAEPPAKKEAE